MIIHNLQVAVRNLLKYKIQTLIGVASIAIGIVTLSLTHSILWKLRPMEYDKECYKRLYMVMLKQIETGEPVPMSYSHFRALRDNGGLACAETLAGCNQDLRFLQTEFHLPDSTVRKGEILGTILDPEYLELINLRSAVTGERIKSPEPGEAIISEDFAKRKFGSKNPIGAVQTTITSEQPIPVRIVDVYESATKTNQLIYNGIFYYVLDEGTEAGYAAASKLYYYPIYVVIKDGVTKTALLKEIESRLSSFGLQPELDKVSDHIEWKSVYLVHTAGYVLGALILLAALIGYFRLQLQLFRLPSRELSLRLVNGASRINLFTLLMTEVGIVIILSVAVALVSGDALERFLNTSLTVLIEEANYDISSLWIVTAITGGMLLILSGLIIWLALSRISRSRECVAANMLRRRNHLFRNFMLGLQIGICLLFVVATLIIVKAGEVIVARYNVPSNDYTLKNSIYLKMESKGNMHELIDEIGRLPALDRMVKEEAVYTAFQEIKENPEAVEKLNREIYFNTFYSDDPGLLSILGVEVEWINPKADRNECIILQRNLYERLGKSGLLEGNTFSIRDHSTGENIPYPIAGIADKMPYYSRGDGLFLFSSRFSSSIEGCILVPKPGKEKELTRSVEETIQRMEPEIINKMTRNFRETISLVPGFMETAVAGGWILAIVSLVVCVMGIYSAIALDTRGRRKEIAIRKVNGAKGRDIYRMFGRVYLILAGAAVVIAVPVCVWINGLIFSLVMEELPEATLSPVWPIVAGIGIIAILITLIVGLQIRRVLGIDPAEVIAKE